MPVHHTEKFEQIPQLSIIFHNDCMYIAHVLLLMGTKHRGRLGELLGGGTAFSFADMVPEFRELARTIFSSQLV